MMKRYVKTSELEIGKRYFNKTVLIVSLKPLNYNNNRIVVTYKLARFGEPILYNCNKDYMWECEEFKFGRKWKQ